MAEMLKGGVTTDVVNVEQARIADDDKTGPGPAAASSCNSAIHVECKTVPDARPLHGYGIGDRVTFDGEGLRGSGVIDAVMPDGSVVWVWTDDAMGRKMLCTADGVLVKREDGPSAKPAG